MKYPEVLFIAKTVITSKKRELGALLCARQVGASGRSRCCTWQACRRGPGAWWPPCTECPALQRCVPTHPLPPQMESMGPSLAQCPLHPPVSDCHTVTVPCSQYSSTTTSTCGLVCFRVSFACWSDNDISDPQPMKVGHVIAHF